MSEDNDKSEIRNIGSLLGEHIKPGDFHKKPLRGISEMNHFAYDLNSLSPDDQVIAQEIVNKIGQTRDISQIKGLNAELDKLRRK